MRLTLTMFFCAAALTVTAQIKTEIKTFNQAGPYAVSAPLGLDTVDVQGKKSDRRDRIPCNAVVGYCDDGLGTGVHPIGV